eukprot:524568-Amphidinium_carterae.1
MANVADSVCSSSTDLLDASEYCFNSYPYTIVRWWGACRILGLKTRGDLTRSVLEFMYPLLSTPAMQSRNILCMPLGIATTLLILTIEWLMSFAPSGLWAFLLILQRVPYRCSHCGDDYGGAGLEIICIIQITVELRLNRSAGTAMQFSGWGAYLGAPH